MWFKKNGRLSGVHVFAGYANPRFLRSTMYNIPCNSDMLKASHIPFALSVTPFSKLGSQEVGIGYLILFLICWTFVGVYSLKNWINGIL